jgi:hypothetical protein
MFVILRNKTYKNMLATLARQAGCLGQQAETIRGLKQDVALLELDVHTLKKNDHRDPETGRYIKG